MFQQNSMPSKKPMPVPRMPTLAPQSRKMRSTLPLVAPMVRSTAMSRPLSFTSMISEEMMLKAATMMISVRIRNITLRSTCTALKKLLLASCQSRMRTGRPARARRISRFTARTRVGSCTKTSTCVAASGVRK